MTLMRMKMLTKTTHRLLTAATVAVMTLCAPVAVAGDGDEVGRPVASMFTVDVGYASVRDTYLTPITYSGLNLRLGYQAMQACGFGPEKWVRSLEVGVEYDNVDNLVGNNTMHSLMVEGRWSLMRRWRVGDKLQLMGGGAAMLRGGAIYNGNNSNNICSVKAHIGVGLAGTAVYPVRLGRLPVTLSYQVNTPVIGAFYSPEYDETYYEIYVGNHSGLVHPAWWGNRFEINNLVSADLHLGNTILRVGYRNHVGHSDVCNLTTHIVTHSFVIGVGGEFLSMGRKSTPRRTVSSIY